MILLYLYHVNRYNFIYNIHIIDTQVGEGRSRVAEARGVRTAIKEGALLV